MTARAFFILPVLVLFTLPVSAQSLGELEGGFIHQFHRPGQATHTVYLLGSVANPGIWRVEQDVDLVELLSAARMQGVGQEDPQVRRATNIRIYRTTADGRELHYETTLAEILRERATYPSLSNNDVIEVEMQRRNRFTWRDASTILGTISSLTVLILRISDFL